MEAAPILICYDGSADARRAIAVAGALLGPRTAVVLAVGSMQAVADSYAGMGSGAAGVERLELAAAHARADAGAELARAAGFRATGQAKVAPSTWRAVIEIADEIDAAAIVIGSRGLGGLRELVEESVSHQVAAHAGRPVLVVRSSAR